MHTAAVRVLAITIRISALEVDLGEVSELGVVDEEELFVLVSLCIHLNNSIILIMLHENCIRTIYRGELMTIGNYRTLTADIICTHIPSSTILVPFSYFKN